MVVSRSLQRPVSSETCAVGRHRPLRPSGVGMHGAALAEVAVGAGRAAGQANDVAVLGADAAEGRRRVRQDELIAVDAEGRAFAELVGERRAEATFPGERVEGALRHLLEIGELLVAQLLRGDRLEPEDDAAVGASERLGHASSATQRRRKGKEIAGLRMEDAGGRR